MWDLEYHFIENLKLMLKENQIRKKAGFIIDQWSIHIDSMPFTLQTMISVITLQQMRFFNSFKKIEIEMNSLGNILY